MLPGVLYYTQSPEEIQVSRFFGTITDTKKDSAIGAPSPLSGRFSTGFGQKTEPDSRKNPQMLFLFFFAEKSNLPR